jgi:hypothetical protein
MTPLPASIALVAFGLTVPSAAEWYFIQGNSPTSIRLQVDGRSTRVSVRKVDLPVSALILRTDTERADWYWLEVSLPDTRDSDAHMLVIDGRAVGEVYTAGQVYTRGNKWAIGFISLEQARRSFNYLRKLHRLDAQHARDATKD